METTSDQVSWNLSQLLILQIGNLLRQASEHFINGSVSNSYVRMQQIRMLIDHDLSDEEKTKLNSLEKDFGGMILNGGSLTKGFKTDEEKVKAFASGRTYYIQYHGAVMAALKKHGYSIPPKQDSSKMF